MTSASSVDKKVESIGSVAPEQRRGNGTASNKPYVFDSSTDAS